MTALEFQILQHVCDVRQKLARLIRCACLCQILKRIQHVFEILTAKVRPAGHGFLIGLHLRLLVSIGDGFRHLCSEVFVRRIPEGFHALLDFILRRPVAQGLLKCAPRCFQSAQGIGGAAIL